MKRFSNFAEFNAYFGTKAPLDNHIDVGNYGNKYLKQSDSVCLDFYRISLKQKIHFPQSHALHHLNEQQVSALFFSSPKDVNGWYVEKRFKGFYVQFSHKVINEHKHIFKKLMDFGRHEPLFLEKQDEEEIEQIYKFMLRHYRENPTQHDILLSYASVLFNFIEKLYLKQLKRPTTSFNSIVVSFQSSLNSYYSGRDRSKENPEIPTVNFFASELDVSANYLGDILKKYTGQSAREHIHNYIIKQAKTRLSKTEVPIKHIALELGFEYPTYFARFFKKKTGMSPSQFRNP